MRLIPPELKLETDLEEESAAALNTVEPRQCEEFIQHKTDLLMREDIIRTEVVNINCTKYSK